MTCQTSQSHQAVITPWHQFRVQMLLCVTLQMPFHISSECLYLHRVCSKTHKKIPPCFLICDKHMRLKHFGIGSLIITGRYNEKKSLRQREDTNNNNKWRQRNRYNMRLDSTLFESKLFKALLVCVTSFQCVILWTSELLVAAWELSAENAAEIDTLGSERENRLVSQLQKSGKRSS